MGCPAGMKGGLGVFYYWLARLMGRDCCGRCNRGKPWCLLCPYDPLNCED